VTLLTSSKIGYINIEIVSASHHIWYGVVETQLRKMELLGLEAHLPLKSLFHK
jgi:hypothetical protein